MNTLKLYTRYIGISIRGQMEYRVSFVMQTLAHFLVTVFEFVAIWALFQRFDNILGWSLYEIAIFYGMISIAFSINDSLTRGFDIFGRLIRNGDFDRYLLRPRSIIVQILGYEFTMKRVGRFSQGLIILLIGATHLQVQWTPGKIVVLLWALFSGVCFFITTWKVIGICLFSYPPLTPPRRGIRRPLPMSKFPSWEGLGVG